MTVIEQLVDALNNSRPHKENFSGFDEFYAACDKHDEAIAAGEAELRREPDHYRAILSASLREQIHTRLHVIVFRDRKSGEDFVESEKTFGGWDYTLEPLYTREETK
jgi:hypothetical protein